MDTLDRSLLKGMVAPFCLSMAGFLVIALSGELYLVMNLVIEKRVPTATVLRLLLYRLPDLSVAAVPIALLFAVLFELGRMSRDFELPMVFVSGRRLLRVATPILIISVIVSIGLFFLGDRVVPEANHRAHQIVRESVLKDVMPRSDQSIFFRGTDNRVFYLGHLSKATMTAEDVMVFELDGSIPSRVLFAAKARLHPREWELQDGTVQEMNQQGIAVSQVRFSAMVYRVEEEIGAFVGEQRTPMEMSRAELRGLIKTFEAAGVNMRAFRVEHEFKLAVPFGCLVLALLGSGLSLGARRNGRFYPVVIALLVAFGYFAAVAALKSLSASGVTPVVISAWLPNGVFAIVGLSILLRGDGVF